MNYDTMLDDELNEKGFVVSVKRGDGLVTCNLSSLVLDRVFVEEELQDEEKFQQLIDIQFRMLDNVISMNRTVVAQATYTNQLYRAVGAGMMGLATLLAEKSIRWDSYEATEYSNEIAKKIFIASVKASSKLGKEKGNYELYNGSDWQTGDYFDKRGLNSDEFAECREMASKHMRNAYLMAIAPTSANSIIHGSSPSLDPLYDVYYYDEKEGYRAIVMPRNYNNRTKWFYKSAFEYDEKWANLHLSKFQLYIDQAISHNLYIHKDTPASKLLDIFKDGWEKGLKTYYYVRIDTSEYDRSSECTACQ